MKTVGFRKISLTNGRKREPMEATERTKSEFPIIIAKRTFSPYRLYVAGWGF